MGDTRPLVIAGGRLLARVGSSDGSRTVALWRIDGKHTEPLLIGRNSVTALGVDPAGRALLAIDDPLGSVALWRSDGTSEGTAPVRDIGPHSTATSPLGFVGSTLLFRAIGDPSEPTRVWRTDGTDAGTSVLAELPFPTFLGNSDGAMLIASDDEIVRTDGTVAGTVSLGPLGHIDNSGRPRALGHVGGAALFVVGDDQLFRSDGTAAGTALVRSFAPPPGEARPLESTVVRPGAYATPAPGAPLTLLFTVDRSDAIGNHVVQVWRTDGTADGTAVVPGLASKPFAMIEAATIGDTTFFPADDGIHGAELWRIDGGSPGASLVQDVQSAAMGWRSGASTARRPARSSSGTSGSIRNPESTLAR
jgi:ELWxxDGT repeat protein